MSLRFLVLALAVVLGGCRSSEAPAPAASATVAEVPAPASLLAELSLGNPKQTWQLLRQLGGDRAQALPSSLPVLLATSLSFPPAVASSLDEQLPMVGVALAGDAGRGPDLVLGMHVVSGAELVASLTLGDGARFRRAELGPRLVRLLPAPGGAEFNGALGVSGNYLLAATRVGALEQAGRFVAESVSKRARTEPGLTLRASEGVVKGQLASALRASWRARREALAARAAEERRERGRPDFADPEALLAGVDGTVESLLGVLESAKELRFTAAPEGDRLRLELSLLPGSEGAAALLASEMVLGRLAPLLRLPSDTAAALLWRGEPQPKEGEAGLTQSLARLFGERLTPEQTERLARTLDRFSRSRRGAVVLGLTSGPTALVATFELADQAAFMTAVPEVLALLELGPVSSWLSGTLGKPSVQRLAKRGEVERARVRFAQAASATALPKTVHASWQARDGVGYVALSAEEDDVLSSFLLKSPLSSSVWLQRTQPELAPRAGLGVFLDASLVAPRGPEEAPLLLTMGKREQAVVIALDVSAPALRAAAGVLR